MSTDALKTAREQVAELEKALLEEVAAKAAMLGLILVRESGARGTEAEEASTNPRRDRSGASCWRAVMDWYKVIKTIYGRKYLYWQKKTYRAWGDQAYE